MRYKYKTKVLSVYDGDTVTINFDLGFNVNIIEKCRLIGIDTPELRTKNKYEKTLGYKVRDYLRELILDKEVEVETHKEGKWGRYLVDIYIDGIHVNQHLIDLNYARVYDGGTREKWTLRYV